MRKLVMALAIVAVLMLGISISVSASSFTVTPWTYYRGENFGEGVHGTAVSQCTPAGLHLAKTEETSGDSASGATIGGVAGITLEALGFDVLAGSHFIGGAPRYNVLTEDQQTHFFGASGAVADESGPAGYQRYLFKLDAEGDGSGNGGVEDKKVLSINVVFDEQGEATLKNFNINGTLVNCVVAVVTTPRPSASATPRPSASATPVVVLAQTGQAGTPTSSWAIFALGLGLFLVAPGAAILLIRRRRT